MKKIEIKKIGFIVPEFMKEILENDQEYFEVSFGRMANKIVEYYSDKKVNKIENLEKGSNNKLQFNLNNRNSEMWQTLMRENEMEQDSEYMRSMLYEYINKPRYKREEIIFYEFMDKYKESQEKSKKLNIKYNDQIRTVNPYAIKHSKEENKLYLLCWCEKNEDYRTYKVSKIKSAILSSDDIEIKDKKKIEEMKKNFEPFRSNNKIIKVKLSEKGREILEKSIFNKPRYIKREKDIYYFECDEKLAQIYFSQFYNEAEILEPEELREKFKDKAIKIYNLYIQYKN